MTLKTFNPNVIKDLRKKCEGSGNAVKPFGVKSRPRCKNRAIKPNLSKPTVDSWKYEERQTELRCMNIVHVIYWLIFE